MLNFQFIEFNKSLSNLTKSFIVIFWPWYQLELFSVYPDWLFFLFFLLLFFLNFLLILSMFFTFLWLLLFFFMRFLRLLLSSRRSFTRLVLFCRFFLCLIRIRWRRRERNTWARLSWLKFKDRRVRSTLETNKKLLFLLWLNRLNLIIQFLL